MAKNLEENMDNINQLNIDETLEDFDKNTKDELILPSGKLASLTKKKKEVLLLLDVEPSLDRDVILDHYAIFRQRLDNFEEACKVEANKNLLLKNRNKLEDWKANILIGIDAFENRVKTWLRANTPSYSGEDEVENIPEKEKNNTEVSDTYCLMKLLLKAQDQARLPKNEPDIFDGRDPTQYIVFKRSFEMNIEKRCENDLDKLSYLEKYTALTPRELVRSCFNAPNGYSKAINLLDKKYNNEYVVAQKYLDKISKFPFIKSDDAKSFENLSLLLCTIGNIMQGMSSLNQLNSTGAISDIIKKLPHKYRDLWRKKVFEAMENGFKVDFEMLTKFVEKQSAILNIPVFGTVDESPNDTYSNQKRKNLVVNTNTEPTRQINKSCPCCKKTNHYLKDCIFFRKKKHEEKVEFVKNNKLCFGCLAPGHFSSNCKKRLTCEKCKKQHPTCLHKSSSDANGSSSSAASSGSSGFVGFNGSSNTNGNNQAINLAVNQKVPTGAGHHSQKILHSVVPVKIKTKGGGYVYTYMALDNFSSDNFISQNLFRKLGFIGKNCDINLNTIDGFSICNTYVLNDLIVCDIFENNFNVLPTVYSTKYWPFTKDDIPTEKDIANFKHLWNIPYNFIDEEIGIIVGANMPSLIKPLQIVEGGEHEPFGALYKFGWSVCGPVNCDKTFHKNIKHCHRIKVDNCLTLEDKIEHYFKSDFEFSNDFELSMSVEDKLFMDLLESSITLSDSKKFEVPLPIRSNNSVLPNNRSQILGRLSSCKRRLLKDEHFYTEYCAFMDTMINNNYTERVPSEELDLTKNVWYLSHHGVYHPTKKKLRVVYDCSLKYKNLCLNDILLQGPDLTNNLVGVLLRFREGEVAFIGDIEKMFYQIRVPVSQRNLMRFFWFENNNLNSDPVEFRICVHVFGAKSSPSCANFALKYTTKMNFEGNYKDMAFSSINKDFYVDDWVKSVSNINEAKCLIDTVCNVVKGGGFNLTSFISNSNELLSTLSKDKLASGIQAIDLFSQNLPFDRVLGVAWNMEDDVLGFSIKIPNENNTRRGILSSTFSVYDPYGIAAPVILPAKRLFQKSCQLKLDWDKELPLELTTEWEDWKGEIIKLAYYEISRWYKYDKTCFNIQLHIFSDASDIAYAAVAYLRFESNYGINCSFVLAKTKLCPSSNKTLNTTPRLELTAAYLAVKLKSIVCRELSLKINEIFFWTDSITVLRYINNETQRYQRFVANKLSFIRANSSVEQWNHVPGVINIADVASRGLKVNNFMSLQQWKMGPDFLSMSREHWPRPPFVDVNYVDDLEIKLNLIVKNFVDNSSMLYNLLQSFSTFYKTKVSVAWILKFVEYVKTKTLPCSSLTVNDLYHAELFIWRYIQNESFSETFAFIRNDKPLPKNNLLKKLNPYIDKNGLLRVGGRLNNLNAAYNVKHPIILPSNNHVVELLVREIHIRLGHLGKESMLSELRKDYWVIKANPLVKKIRKSCIICLKNHARPSQQLMADLPEDRLKSDEKAFSYIGIDCFGPFNVVQGRTSYKRYGLIISCLSSRAIHIEILHSLDCDSFICAFRRFVARRGPVKCIRSDNGTNFVGSNKILNSCIDEWNRGSSTWRKQNNIDWIFHPPASSHFGGVYEREIRTIRNVLNGLIWEQKIKLTDERLNTLFCEVEGILNSRPLTAVSDDVNDLQALTPNHLLMSDSVVTFPPGLFDKKDLYVRRRWRQVQYLAELFWSRWQKEYVPLLQERQKWFIDKDPHKVGDLVLVVEQNLPRNQWVTGRIAAVNRDREGRVRSARVRVANAISKRKQIECEVKELERPIVKLILLKSVSNE